jgi:hypothetical protein
MSGQPCPSSYLAFGAQIGIRASITSQPHSSTTIVCQIELSLTGVLEGIFEALEEPFPELTF